MSAWVAHFDEGEEKYYYHNETTDETTWEKPDDYTHEELVAEEPAAKRQRVDDDEPLMNATVISGGWEAHYDEGEQKYYFHNEATGETTWEKPEGFVAAEGEGAGDASTGEGAASGGGPEAGVTASFGEVAADNEAGQQQQHGFDSSDDEMTHAAKEDEEMASDFAGAADASSYDETTGFAAAEASQQPAPGTSTEEAGRGAALESHGVDYEGAAEGDGQAGPASSDAAALAAVFVDPAEEEGIEALHEEWAEDGMAMVGQFGAEKIRDALAGQDPGLVRCLFPLLPFPAAACLPGPRCPDYSLSLHPSGDQSHPEARYPPAPGWSPARCGACDGYAWFPRC